MKKRNQKKFSIKTEYAESWRYIKKSRNFIYAIAILFVLFVFLGFVIPAPEAIMQKLLELIEGLLAKTKGMSGIQITSFIFFNNIQSSFFGMIFGIVFGIFSVFTTIINGYLLGFVAYETVKVEGVFILWRLLPHGIFEIPALILSMALGLKLGTFAFKKEKVKSFRDYFWNSLRVFIFVVIPLLLVAAIIEGILISIVG